jgi:tRNA A-37 threonylcarbamoyl transferase component Bud32
MKTLDLVNSPTVPVEVSAAIAATQSDSTEQDFDGRRWTCRNGFERVLRRLPSSAWDDPTGQGWQCVKRNSSRSVWRAEIGDRAYYIKYYESKGWLSQIKNHLRRPACIGEWDGGLFAIRSGIEVVQPAAFSIANGKDQQSASILVTEAAEPSWPVNAFWRLLATDDDLARQRQDRNQLVDRLAELIARAHQAGFEHLDMHAENILVQRTGPREFKAVFVDLHSARRDVPLSERAVVRNLAQLNQWFRQHAALAERLRFLKAYLRWRNEFEHQYPHARRLESDYADLVRACAGAADRHAQRLWAGRDRRIGRPGRYFDRLRLIDGWSGQVFLRTKRQDSLSPSSRLALKRDWWRRTLNDYLRDLDAPAAEVDVKDSHSASVTRTVWTTPDGEKISVLIKRPRARNAQRQLRMLAPPSRSRRAWRIANALLNRNIRTPRPLAVLERKTGPLIRDSVFVTEFVEQAQDLEAWLSAPEHQAPTRAAYRSRRDLLERLVRLLRQFHQRGFVHRDCKAGNILVAPEADGSPALLWTDMDGIRLSNHVSQADVDRALMRLFVSLSESGLITRTDAVRFLIAYESRFGAQQGQWRNTWCRIEPLVSAKQAQRERRKAWKQAAYGRV